MVDDAASDPAVLPLGDGVMLKFGGHASRLGFCLCILIRHHPFVCLRGGI